LFILFNSFRLFHSYLQDDSVLINNNKSGNHLCLCFAHKHIDSCTVGVWHRTILLATSMIHRYWTVNIVCNQPNIFLFVSTKSLAHEAQAHAIKSNCLIITSWGTTTIMARLPTFAVTISIGTKHTNSPFQILLRREGGK